MSEQSDTAVVERSIPANMPDYHTVEVPRDKEPDEYTYAERRGELLDAIHDQGHPRFVDQNDRADRYDVSQQMISKDLDRLGEYVSERLDHNRELETQAVFERCIQGLLEDEEWRKAAKTASDYDDWVTQRGEVEELADMVDMLTDRMGEGR